MCKKLFITITLLVGLFLVQDVQAETVTITYTWDAATSTDILNEGLTAVRVYQDSSANMIGEYVPTVGGASIQVELTGCSNFWSRRVNAVGESDNGTVQVICLPTATPADPPAAIQMVPPTPVIDFDATLTLNAPIDLRNKEYSFSWSTNAEPVEGYKLYYKKGGAPSPPSMG